MKTLDIKKKKNWKDRSPHFTSEDFPSISSGKKTSNPNNSAWGKKTSTSNSSSTAPVKPPTMAQPVKPPTTQPQPVKPPTPTTQPIQQQMQQSIQPAFNQPPIQPPTQQQTYQRNMAQPMAQPMAQQMHVYSNPVQTTPNMPVWGPSTSSIPINPYVLPLPGTGFAPSLR